MAFEPSKFTKRQVHLQLTKVRNRNAAYTLDQNTDLQTKRSPHDSAETLLVDVVGVALPKTVYSCQLSSKTDNLNTTSGVHGNLNAKVNMLDAVAGAHRRSGATRRGGWRRCTGHVAALALTCIALR